MVYNARVEQKIKNLTNPYPSEKRTCLEIIENLGEAYELVKTSFIHSSLDSPEDSIKRVEAKLQTYNMIVDAYDLFGQSLIEIQKEKVPGIPEDIIKILSLEDGTLEEFYEKIKKLEATKNTTQSNYEAIVKENETAQDKVTDLDFKVSQLQESQKGLEKL